MSLKSVKVKLVLCVYIVSVFMVSLGAVIISNPSKAQASEASEAYFLTEDRQTQGFWYNGDNGLKDNPELDRNYGGDGLVLFFHWLRQNGQMCLDPVKLNDFTDDSGYYPNGEKANYVEYPSYVDSIEGNITTIGDDPFGYWMNTPQTLSTSLGNSQNGIQPLPIEGPYHDEVEFTWSHGGFACKPGGVTEFTIEMNDDDWHTFTYYVGSPWRHKYNGLDNQWMKLYDLDGNLIAQHRVDNANQGVHVRFAVKGSFKVQYYGDALTAYSNGIFFDKYEKNEDIGTSNLEAELEGSKIINLSWENKLDTTYTAIFRRIVGDTLWTPLAQTNPGVTTYKDTTSVVSRVYEYALASGTVKTKDPKYIYRSVKADFIEPAIVVKTFNLPDFENSFEKGTAIYKMTKIEFAHANYGAEQNVALEASARLFKTEDDGVTYEPYAGIEVTFILEGDNVNSDLGTSVYPNMNNLFKKGTTDANGDVTVSNSVPYAGEYKLVASIEPQPEENPFYGYDSCSANVSLSITPSASQNVSTPFLMSISDAIKPGEAVNLVGQNMQDDGELKIAYRKNEGKVPAAYDTNKVYSYIGQNDIMTVDSINGTGIMFNFPENAKAGIYDFYVHNSSGWSNGITMNAARPLYLDQEGAYEGQEIQIVGRNFLQNEYGVGDLESALSTLKVKLTQVADKSGAAASYISYTLTAANGGILTGNKITKENALQFENDKLQAEDIPYTYSLRITIKIPAIYDFGTYEVTVASDGKDFRALTDNCKLVIYEKKAQNWNETVFGAMDGNTHVGNDPLDLGVYWAQDLNYTRIETMSPSNPNNTFDTAQEFTSEINQKITALSNAGGGVLYFPEGTYYLYSSVALKKGVMIVGAGEDKTSFIYSNNKDISAVWFSGAKEQINSGIARVSLSAKDARLETDNDTWYAPKYVFKWDGDGTTTEDKVNSTVKNRFLINIKADMFGGTTVQEDQCQRMIAITGQNCMIKNAEFLGMHLYTELTAYGTLWNVKFIYYGAVETSPHWMGRYCFMENSYIDMQGMGHGPSIKSDQYIAFSYVTNTGNRANPTNDGEVLLMEAPSGTFSTGKVLTSERRSITLDFTGGAKILSTTVLRYNMCAVYISDGTGQGQYRYIKITGTGDYKNRYELMDWEKDWDIMPDHTSVFACMAPLANTTVYHLKAYDCVSSICVYSNHFDTVIDGCTLVNTAGITGGGLASGGMGGGRINPVTNVRIVNNDISGVGVHTDAGLSIASVGQFGGIQFYGGGSGGAMGILTFGLMIKNNYLHDMIPELPFEKEVTMGTGIVIYFRGGQDNNANAIRYIIIEDNIIENSQWGIKIDRTMNGVVLKNNEISNTTLLSTDTTINRPIGFYANAIHSLYVNGVLSDLSGEYEFESTLPAAPAVNGKVFIGWTKDATITSSTTFVTQAYAQNVTLYAVYGYELVFDFNYKTAAGSAKGEYASIKVLEGGSVKSALEAYGDPFRLEHDFEGWYTDRSFKTAFNADSEITASGTIYAKWSGEEGIVTPPTETAGCKSGFMVTGSIFVSVLAMSAALLLVRKKRRV